MIPFALPRNAAIVWDLDHTLLPMNVGGEFIRSLLTQKQIAIWKRYRFYVAYVLFHSYIIDAETALREALGIFEGMELAFLEKAARAFVQERVKPGVFPEALERLQFHRSQGDTLVLISGSPEFVVRPVGLLLCFNNAIGTRYVVRDGFVTRTKEPICYGEGKLALLHAEALTVVRPHVYTDDVMDLPMLKIAGSASLINPNPALISEVESLGIPFEVLRWV
jgi:HAD superfamily hydrolase (TIGR01490 family)